MPLPLTVSCFSKIQIGFTFLVPAHLRSPGKRAVKRVCVCSDAGDYMWRSGMSWNIQLGGGDAGSCSRGSYLGVGGGCSVQPGDGGSRLDLLQMTTPPLNAQQQPDELVLEFLLN